MTSNAEKSLNIIAITLSIPYNYFDPTKLFSDLYLIKFLNTSAKSLLSYQLLSKFMIIN